MQGPDNVISVGSLSQCIYVNMSDFSMLISRLYNLSLESNDNFFAIGEEKCFFAVSFVFTKKM